MSIKKFKEEEIPYEKLEKVGLSRQMIEDLPEDALDKVLSGQLSPVVPLNVTTEDGKTYESRGRFSIYVKEDGEVSAKIHPVMKPIGETMQVAKVNDETGKVEYQDIPTSERYSKQVIDQLKDGKVVLDYLYHPDGTREQAYLQLDEETNGIIGIPSEAVNRNLEIVNTELHLTKAEGNCLNNGGLVTYSTDEDELLTVGLDLRSPSGIRFTVGDEKKWQESKQRDWDKYELGVNGCWMTDDEGNLQYIPEDEFDELDIWNEVEKQHERKKQAETPHRGLTK